MRRFPQIRTPHDLCRELRIAVGDSYTMWRDRLGETLERVVGGMLQRNADKVNEEE